MSDEVGEVAQLCHLISTFQFLDGDDDSFQSLPRFDQLLNPPTFIGVCSFCILLVKFSEYGVALQFHHGTIILDVCDDSLDYITGLGLR